MDERKQTRVSLACPLVDELPKVVQSHDGEWPMITQKVGELAARVVCDFSQTQPSSSQSRSGKRRLAARGYVVETLPPHEGRTLSDYCREALPMSKNVVPSGKVITMTKAMYSRKDLIMDCLFLVGKDGDAVHSQVGNIARLYRADRG